MASPSLEDASTEKEGSYEDNPPAEVSTPTTTSESSTAEISGGKDGPQDAQKKKPIGRSDTNHSSDENTLLAESEPVESSHAIRESNDGSSNEVSDHTNGNNNKVELNDTASKKEEDNQKSVASGALLMSPESQTSKKQMAPEVAERVAERVKLNKEREQKAVPQNNRLFTGGRPASRPDLLERARSARLNNNASNPTVASGITGQGTLSSRNLTGRKPTSLAGRKTIDTGLSAERRAQIREGLRSGAASRSSTGAEVNKTNSR